ncbi:hypothetical protein TVAG_193150 [Trichomonas vaginalis G3]|uniref:Uncharacterized protein n=1 Tax=Trichomonas vaginalis (strain ATCC PRA-98 / G3) TaxID=412133 RepID=A2DH29_TRIV3|nr:ankyrin repeat protein family [Trichomonas vaginalis G3]EAY20339.1 hypothetical protein TVAG_193150 [Trichomonas vaginalis G3]KAI5530671.1 ankyrin repeat protein family [Trichomonas vaginalis G3]|eukprot:XP_001581325.1 hypothetical protein [Trichomonas vaginalis G3]
MNSAIDIKFHAMIIELTLDYEYIGAHINEYIEAENLFDVFYFEDLEMIFKYVNMTPEIYNSIHKLANGKFDISKLFKKSSCTAKNLQDVISTLEIIKENMNVNLLNDSIIVLKNLNVFLSDPSILENSDERIRTGILGNIDEQERTRINEYLTLRANNKEKDLKIAQLTEMNNKTTEYLKIISEYDFYTDFDTVYNLFKELIEKDNTVILKIAINGGLTEHRGPGN